MDVNANAVQIGNNYFVLMTVITHIFAGHSRTYLNKSNLEDMLNLVSPGASNSLKVR